MNNDKKVVNVSEKTKIPNFGEINFFYRLECHILIRDINSIIQE